jgi:hypothetical protein
MQIRHNTGREATCHCSKDEEKGDCRSPLYAALPIVLKIPAPTIPATPSAVRSMTERLLLRCNPPESDSVLYSEYALWTSFLKVLQSSVICLGLSNLIILRI